MHKVKDVMTQGGVSLEEDTTFKEIVRRMESSRASSLPVLDGSGHLVGVVSEAELLPREAGAQEEQGSFSRFLHHSPRHDPEAAVAREIMDPRADSVGQEIPLAEAAQLMCDKHVIRLPVVEEDGRVTGTVTWRDLLSVFMRSDRAIKKEIDDWICGAAGLEPFTVIAAVREGVVTLEGQLEGPRQLQPVLGFVRSVAGVIRVVNRLSCPKEGSVFGPGRAARKAHMPYSRPGVVP